MNKMVKWFLALLVLLVSACSNNDGNDHKTVFNLNLDDGLTSLDPAFARNQNAIWMDNQLYNGLVQLDENLKVQPCIAKHWDISSDGLQYTFHLRTDVYFQDDGQFKNGIGRKVTAADFVYSFGRLIDAKVGSSGSWIFSDKVAGMKSFAALDDSTFSVKLKQPFPPMLSLLSSAYCSVVPHEVVDFYGKDFRSHPIGTGPFKFKYWKEGEVLVLLKNGKYWEKDSTGNHLPYLDAVRASFIPAKQTAFMAFIKKDLDFFNGINGSYRDDILTKSGHIPQKYKGKFMMVTHPYLNTEYLGIMVDTNLAIVKASPLKLLKIRQAINYAIDRQSMIKYLRNSMCTPGDAGFIPKGMPGFDDKKVKGYNYDPGKARALLAEAGFPNGKGLPEITLTTVSTYRDLIEYIQGELNQIGIKTRVEVMEGASLREQIAKNSVGFFRASWNADYPDGENYLSVFYSKNRAPIGPNYTVFNDNQFDALYKQGYLVKSDSARYALYQQMDNLMMHESPVVVLYYDNLVNLYQNNISGYRVNGMNLLTLKYIKKNN
jgi:oligopeptide transport system substrate-binding protein